MDDILSKYNWKKIDVASSISDDIWIKDKYDIVRGFCCSTFYLEKAVKDENGSCKFLSVHDPNRKTIQYKISDILEAIDYVEFDIASRKEEIRDKKLIQLGI